MPFTSRQMVLLRQLEFSEEHIATQLVQLDEAELSTALKRQQRKLSAKYHPDRTEGNAELTKKFIEMVAAVEELTNSKDVISSLLEAIVPFDYQIPVDCIDHRIKEQIDDYFETMSHYFNSLSSKNEQQQCIAENKTFLQFVLWLHQHSAEIRKAQMMPFIVQSIPHPY